MPIMVGSTASSTLELNSFTCTDSAPPSYAAAASWVPPTPTTVHACCKPAAGRKSRMARRMSATLSAA
jgi:hypothetical protein